MPYSTANYKRLGIRLLNIHILGTKMFVLFSEVFLKAPLNERHL